MLDPLSRGAIVAMSVAFISGAVALTPLRARSSNDPNVHNQLVLAPLVTTTVPEITIRRDPFGGEPSNTPAAGSTTPRGTPRVTAIVTGARPYAMFDFAGNHQIKGVGDRVNGTPISAIDIEGVTLQSGARLRVTAGELPQ
jgi:hypothetical protein